MKRTRLTLLALAAAGALALSGCASGGGDAGGGETATPEPEPTFAEGSTMAALAEAGTITIGTKFDQPLFGLVGPSGVPEGFDVEIGKIIAGRARHRRRRHRVGRVGLGQPRAVHPERRGRHRRRDVHDQRQAQGGRLLRRPVLHGRPVDPRARRQRRHRDRRRPRRPARLLGDRLDAGRQPRGARG